MLNSTSLRRLEGVHPDARAVTKLAAQKIASRSDGITFQIPQYGGYRTEAEQRVLVDRGVSKTMNSNHRKGLAVDVLPYINNVDAWTYDNQRGKGSNEAAFRTVNAAMMNSAAELGLPLEWGFAMWGWDMPHHQLDPDRYPAGLSSPSLIGAHDESRFADLIGKVLATEGGWNADDPSMHGVKLDTLSLYLGRPASITELKSLSVDNAKNIYRSLYWSPVRGDDFRPGIDYALLDFAVHSGPPRAAMELQSVVGVEVDGVIGPVTLAATRSKDAKAVIRNLMDERLEYMKGLGNWGRYANGWTERVKRVRADSLGMVKAETPPPLPPSPEPEPPEELPAVQEIVELLKKRYGAKSVLVEW